MDADLDFLNCELDLHHDGQRGQAVACKKTYRLTLLLSQHFGEVVGMLLKSVGEVEDGLLPFVPWSFGPYLESFPCSRYSFVDILLR